MTAVDDFIVSLTAELLRRQRVQALRNPLDFSIPQLIAALTELQSSLSQPILGSFTPGLTFGGNNVGMNLSSVLGDYYKIGRLVWVTGNFFVVAKGSSVGAAKVTGLPFVGNAPNNSSQMLSPYWLTINLATAGRYVGLSVDNLATTISIVECSDNIGSVSLTDAAFTSNASRIHFTGSYLTTN